MSRIVKLSCLLVGYPENLNKGYATDNNKLAALTEAYLNQEVEVWPESNSNSNTTIIQTPKKLTTNKRQISETSTPSPKKKQKKQHKTIAKSVLIQQQQQPEIEQLEPDVWVWQYTDLGIKPVHKGGSFAAFNAMMAKRTEELNKIKKEEEAEQEEQDKMLEFYDCCGDSIETDIGSLYDNSDSLLNNNNDTVKVKTEAEETDNMECHETLDHIPELIL